MEQWLQPSSGKDGKVRQRAFIMPSIQGEKTNLTKEFQDTDRTIQKIRWKTYGPQKLFDTKLRFRIRLDDFRYVKLDH